MTLLGCCSTDQLALPPAADICMNAIPSEAGASSNGFRLGCRGIFQALNGLECSGPVTTGCARLRHIVHSSSAADLSHFIASVPPGIWQDLSVQDPEHCPASARLRRALKCKSITQAADQAVCLPPWQPVQALRKAQRLMSGQSTHRPDLTPRRCQSWSTSSSKIIPAST